MSHYRVTCAQLVSTTTLVPDGTLDGVYPRTPTLSFMKGQFSGVLFFTLHYPLILFLLVAAREWGRYAPASRSRGLFSTGAPSGQAKPRVLLDGAAI